MGSNAYAPRYRANETMTSSRLGAAPFVASAFLGAALIFLVQPMFAKMATPLLGGSPSVWNVSLVCFQAALLAGYAYAHLLARLSSLPLQMAVHGGLLVVGFLFLPMKITGLLGAPNVEQPALWLIGVFGLSIAAPFALVSATAPLIQHWYAKTNRADASDPYHLYAASNVGSLIGLAAYPLAIEPFLRVASQSVGWTAGYVILAALLGLSGALAVMAQRGAEAPGQDATGAAQADGEKPALSWRERAFWLALAFIPSSLLVGATTHITTDIASAPMLWAPPLMVYLLSFVFVFSRKSPVSVDAMRTALPGVAALAAFFLIFGGLKVWALELAVTLCCLFVVAMVCHGALAERRPHVSRLTEFYLLMSLGGVLGGAFNALLAPIIFEGIYEYPLMIAIALGVLPATLHNFDRTGRLLLLTLAGVFIAAIIIRVTIDSTPLMAAVVFLAALVLVLSRGRRLAVVGAFGVMCVAGGLFDFINDRATQRGFFGIVEVAENDETRVLRHGTTLHGMQFIDGEHRLSPLSYYAEPTPIGQVFSASREGDRIGVVGLGAGSVACYGKPGQEWSFYEIDPIVVDFATNPDYFTFMSGCQPGAEIILGDARVRLTDAAQGQFDLLLLDAFSSDAVPVHLMTREAVRLYLSLLKDDGVLLMHISNRHLDLGAVVARVAAAESAPALVQIYRLPKKGETSDGEDVDRLAGLPTHAVVMARDEAALDRFKASGKWTVMQADDGRAWTDDYSNIVGAMITKAFPKRDEGV